MTGTPVGAAESVEVPSVLNVAVEYVDGPVTAGHGERVAYIHDGRPLTYFELQERVNQVGNALAGLGVEIEQRVAILLPNSSEFVTSFFGAIKIGAVPTPISYAVTPHEQAFLLADSRARAIVTTAGFWEPLRTRRGEWPFLRHVLIVGGGALAPGERDFAAIVGAAPGTLAAAPTSDEDVAFWLHTSGSTGTPKWAVHLQRDMLYSERLYAAPFVGLGPDDVIVCGSPSFHAYPLGFTTYFALKAGATVVLNAERSTPARMFHLIRSHRATVFVGVPTLYAQMLQAAAAGQDAGQDADLSTVRLCLAAAEPLPADVYRRWRERFRVDILDGIGSTEALHIFISNRAGEVRPGSSGHAVPGYRVRLVDDGGADVPQGEAGISSSAAAASSRATGTASRSRSGSCGASGTTHGRQVPAGRRRLLLVHGPRRRFAARQRALGLARRGGGSADLPSGGAGGGRRAKRVTCAATASPERGRTRRRCLLQRLV